MPLTGWKVDLNIYAVPNFTADTAADRTQGPSPRQSPSTTNTRWGAEKTPEDGAPQRSLRKPDGPPGRERDAPLALRVAPLNAQVTGRGLHGFIVLQATVRKARSRAAPQTRICREHPEEPILGLVGPCEAYGQNTQAHGLGDAGSRQTGCFVHYDVGR